MFSIIYTPTEGEAIANYSRIFRRPGGCFLNIEDIDRVDTDIAQWGEPDDIDIIVVSDGEQVTILQIWHAHPLTDRPDTGNWGPRRRRHSNLGSQARALHFMRWHPPRPGTASCSGLRYECKPETKPLPDSHMLIGRRSIRTRNYLTIPSTWD